MKKKIILHSSTPHPRKAPNGKRVSLHVVVGAILLMTGGISSSANAISSGVWPLLINGTQKDLISIISNNIQVVAKNQNDPNAHLILGIAYHNLALEGNTEYTDLAFLHAEKAYHLNPTSQIALVYLGSIETLQARESWNPFVKLSKVNSGIEKIDLAVKNEPNNLVVRLVRASNSIALPESFNRIHYAKSDLRRVIEIAPESSEAIKAREILKSLNNN